MKVTFHNDPQGSEAWLQCRKGRITGSRFKDTRERLKNGDLSAKCRLYAMNVARERIGGTAEAVFVNRAMQFGTEQEPLARSAYETTTGNAVVEVGFAATDCGMFGVSCDGLIGADGVLEIKTMVSSDTLFTAVVNRDYSAYMDQCLGYLLFLERKWVDLCLWAPDLESVGLGLSIHRIHRDEPAIAALKADLNSFADIVRQYESELRNRAAQNLATIHQLTA